MDVSNRMKIAATALVILGGGMLLRSSDFDATAAFAQAAGTQSQGSGQQRQATPPPPAGTEEVDRYDRSALLYATRRTGATTGWQRGQEIYYMRCWMCHNEYTMAGDPAPAPSLRDVFERRNEEFVRAQIRNGSSRMPTYTVKNLPDADLDDLVTYLREKCGTFKTGGGCFDEHNPPPNPLYRF